MAELYSSYTQVAYKKLFNRARFDKKAKRITGLPSEVVWKDGRLQVGPIFYLILLLIAFSFGILLRKDILLM